MLEIDVKNNEEIYIKKKEINLAIKTFFLVSCKSLQQIKLLEKLNLLKKEKRHSNSTAQTISDASFEISRSHHEGNLRS